MTFHQPVTAPEEPSLPRLRKVGGLGSAATVLLGLGISAIIASDVAGIWLILLVQDYVQGTADVTAAEFARIQSFITTTVWILVGLAIATIVVFLVWLRRARLNAEALSLMPHRRARGWAIGGWFCPLVNLWFPYQIVADVWKASRPGPGPRMHVVGWWWGLFLAGQFLERVVSRMSDELNISTLRSVLFLGVISSACTIGAGVLLIVVVQRITGWQSMPRPLVNQPYVQQGQHL